MSQELEAQKWVMKESSGLGSALLHAEEGAPLRRGPRGLLAKLGELTMRPEVRVWGAPAARCVGIFGVLGCVAFLGKQSEEESLYGARVPLSVSTAQESASAPPEPAEEKAHTELVLAETAPAAQAPTPCSEKKEDAKSSAILPDGRIIMNEATQSDFTRLKGVGEARAAKIIELRTRLGKFRQVADLMRVRGIGYKTLQSMKGQLVVDRPVEKEAPPDASPEKPVGEPPAPRPSSS